MGGRKGWAKKLEYSALIDASTFSGSYNAFWNASTPTCEHFIRRLNLGGLERYSRPMAQSKTSKRRAVIAEYAFALFVEMKRDGMKNSLGEAFKTKRIKEEAWIATAQRLSPFVGEGLNLSNDFDEDELREVEEIKSRLLSFFSNPARRLVLRPVFKGCGYIDASEGDVIFGTSIYEIKTVERLFRSNDIRQLITYGALNYASRQFSLNKIGLFNPRRGQFCELEIDMVCAEIAGQPAQDLFATIVDAMSSGDISR
jgi:hypothetical protein